MCVCVCVRARALPSYFQMGQTHLLPVSPDSGVTALHPLPRNALWGFLVVAAPLVPRPTFSLVQGKTEI